MNPLLELVQGLQNQNMSPLLAHALKQTLAAQARGNPLQPITNRQSIPASEPANEKAQTPVVVPAVDENVVEPTTTPTSQPPVRTPNSSIPESEAKSLAEEINAEWEPQPEEPQPEPQPEPQLETLEAVEDDVEEEEGDGTPPEKPPTEIHNSDANVAKRVRKSKNDKSIDWGVKKGEAGIAARTLEKKTQLFTSILQFHEKSKKWPNQVEMIQLAKDIGVTALYSTIVDQIRIASSAALDRQKKKNDCAEIVRKIEDHESAAYASALADLKKLEKDIAKFK
ncbi:hypothetical protein CYMTET_42025 [Cymbomonas tetramitiformis]|uniref:Uncharacterized protein n=1 Tax=Cymbomonas tetramitiformis TaxID=36881 RepID=A0AAE0F1N2_9CHLO|nr:hypothetical protein CYMTET_42025 [Cymbomonas tetramitiformis]